jgi:hypothetical protein
MGRNMIPHEPRLKTKVAGIPFILPTPPFGEFTPSIGTADHARYIFPNLSSTFDNLDPLSPVGTGKVR